MASKSSATKRYACGKTDYRGALNDIRIGSIRYPAVVFATTARAQCNVECPEEQIGCTNLPRMRFRFADYA